MLSGHKAGSEAGRDRDRKKRTTDSCAEVCSTAKSGCGLSVGRRCVCCLCKRTWRHIKSIISMLIYSGTVSCISSIFDSSWKRALIVYSNYYIGTFYMKLSNQIVVKRSKTLKQQNQRYSWFFFFSFFFTLHCSLKIRCLNQAVQKSSARIVVGAADAASSRLLSFTFSNFIPKWHITDQLESTH